MKKIKLTLIAALAVTCSVISVQATNNTLPPNPIIDTVIVTIDSLSNDCSSSEYRSVRISGVNFEYSSPEYYTRNKNCRRDRNWRWNFGRYSGYSLNHSGLVEKLSNLSLPDDADFMSLSPKSIGIDINFCDFALVSNGAVSLVTGLGLEVNNYRFDKNVTLQKNAEGVIVPDYKYEERGIKLSKSKLTTTYLNIPLLVHLDFGSAPYGSRQFWISGGVVGGVLLQSHTKVKSSETGKVKDRNNQNIRNFHFGYLVSVGYGAVALTAKYYPHSIFKSGMGPQVEHLSIGLGIHFAKKYSPIRFGGNR